MKVIVDMCENNNLSNIGYDISFKETSSDIFSTARYITEKIPLDTCESITVQKINGGSYYLNKKDISGIIHRHMNSLVFLDNVLVSLKRHDIEKASRAWSKLYELFDTKDDESELIRAINTVMLQKFTSKISDNDVYAITDYLKREYYAKMS